MSSTTDLILIGVVGYAALKLSSGISDMFSLAGLSGEADAFENIMKNSTNYLKTGQTDKPVVVNPDAILAVVKKAGQELAARKYKEGYTAAGGIPGGFFSTPGTKVPNWY